MIRAVAGPFWLSALAAVQAVAVTPPADLDRVPFDSDRWNVTGELVTHLDRQALRGAAVLADADFLDGVIEVDVAVDGRRTFPGITFRGSSEGNAEIFYLRPHHNSSSPHALHYTPIDNGLTAWQLYCGPGFTAGADIPHDQWIHLRLEVAGDRARVFFGDMERPALTIPDLQREAAAGSIGLTGPADGSVHWADFRYSKRSDLDLGPPLIQPPAAHSIRSWELSQPFAAGAVNRTLPPDLQDLGELQWQPVEADGRGLVNIGRHVAKPGQGSSTVFARTTIDEESAVRRVLAFGYSDQVTVFLNGRPVFAGDSSFHSRDESFMGAVGLNDRLFLDLDQGANQLVLAVTESFGGWGFVTSLEEVHGEPVVLHPSLTEAWSLREGLRLPEAAVWDPKRQVFYISNMNPVGPGDMGEQGFVTRVQPDGTVTDLEWITGLRAPTGMAVHGDTLWVVERSGLAEVDLTTGTLAARHQHAGAFLNDVAAGPDGAAYVSDTAGPAVFRLRNGEWETFLEHEAVARANGLAVVGNTLFVAPVVGGRLVEVDIPSRTVTRMLALGDGGGDGLVADGEGNLLVSFFEGVLMRVTPEDHATVLLDSTAAGRYCTDFAFSPTERLLVVPTLYGGEVVAYTVRER